MATSNTEQKQPLGDFHCPASRSLKRPADSVPSDLQSKALLSSCYLQLHLRLLILSDACGTFLRWFSALSAVSPAQQLTSSTSVISARLLHLWDYGFSEQKPCCFAQDDRWTYLP